MKTQKLKSKPLRYLIALALGLVSAIVIGQLVHWQYAPLVGWDVFALAVVAMLIWDLHGHSDREMADLARRDDMNHSLSDIVVTFASVMSIASVFVLLAGRAQEAHTLMLHVGLGLITIVSSWLLLHTLYTVRYIALYYRPKPEGIEFPGTEHPRFSDFVYFAFTIGMTYQVSDTTVTDSEIRAVVIRHAIMSYIFGTAIIAASINMIVSLGS